MTRDRYARAVEKRLSPERRVETISLIFGLAGAAMGVAIESQAGPCLIVLACILYAVSVLKYRSSESYVAGRVVIVAALGCLGVWWVERKISEKKLEAREGVLEPGGMSCPPNDCKIPPGAFAVHIADGVYIVTGRQPIISETNPDGSIRKELLTVSAKNGTLEIDAAIFDDRQDLVAKVEHGHFISTPFASYQKRPNKSTYAVYNHKDEQVLDIEMPNETCVIVRKADMYTSNGRHRINVDGSVMKFDEGPRGWDAEQNCFDGVWKTLIEIRR